MKKKKDFFKKNSLSPKKMQIIWSYLSGQYQNQAIAKKFSVRPEFVSRTLNSPIAKKYIDDHFKQADEAQKENLKKMREMLRISLEKQIIEGKTEVRIFFNRKSEMTSKVETKIPWSFRELMDLSKLSGDYNPLKGEQTSIKKEEEEEGEDYKEVLAQIKSWKKKSIA